jgi:cytochrome c oxidase cbb3-type subunit 2
MIRTLVEETQRYGAVSRPEEFIYDHPFQWGSKRTGPDLARVGGKYSDAWHVAHLMNPRSVVPQSIMPSYQFLFDTPLDARELVANVQTNRELGTPYTDDMMANVMTDLKAQVSAPDSPEAAALLKRYPKAVVRKFYPGSPEITEGDAVVAYLQMLGTLVDFKLYDDKANLR